MLTDAEKEIYLLRTFSSLAYFKAFKETFDALVTSIENGLDYFYSHPPQGWEQWPEWKKPDVWKERILGDNFYRYQYGVKGIDEDGRPAEMKGIHAALQEAYQGRYKSIENWAATVHGLGGDMRDISDEWWSYIPDQMGREYGATYGKLSNISANIEYTLDNRWNPGEILDEEITGPIDYTNAAQVFKNHPCIPLQRMSGQLCPAGGFWVVEGHAGYGRHYKLGEALLTREECWKVREAPVPAGVDDQPVTWRMIVTDPLQGGEEGYSGQPCLQAGYWMLIRVGSVNVDFKTREFRLGELFPEVEGKPATWVYMRPHE